MDKQVALQKAAALLRESGATVEELGRVMRQGSLGADHRISGQIHLSDWMFFAGGAVLCAALQFAIVLSVPELNIARMLLAALAAMVLWIPAMVARRRTGDGLLAGGISRALLLAGSWSWCLVPLYAVDALRAGYVMTFSLSLYVLTAGFMAIGVLHIGYDRVVRSAFALGMATLALWVAVICVVIGTLQLDDQVHTLSIYQAVTLLLTTALPAVAYGVTWRQYYSELREGFMVVGQLLTLLAIFIFTLSPTNAALWHLAMLAALSLLFYRGISHKKRASFIVAAIFLVLSIIAFSFRYFISGGVAVSLFISAMAVLGVATGLTLVHKSTFGQQK